MFKKLAQLFSGDPHKRKIETLKEIVDQINALEPAYEALSDDALAAKTEEFRARLADGETLDDLLVEAFATVRETSKRTCLPESRLVHVGRAGGHDNAVETVLLDGIGNLDIC